MKRMYALPLCLAAVVLATRTGPGGTSSAAGGDGPTGKAPPKAAVERARKTVRMLDDIYKQTIVLITDKYVKAKGDYAAGRAAVLLFKNISKSGSHTVRLLDATGEPYDPNNVAKDDFEREGIRRLKKGAKIHEQVVEIDGKPQLRSITPVPVVMARCVMCHENYAKAKKGEPIGAISYIVPIE